MKRWRFVFCSHHLQGEKRLCPDQIFHKIFPVLSLDRATRDTADTITFWCPTPYITVQLDPVYLYVSPQQNAINLLADKWSD